MPSRRRLGAAMNGLALFPALAVMPSLALALLQSALLPQVLALPAAALVSGALVHDLSTGSERYGRPLRGLGIPVVWFGALENIVGTSGHRSGHVVHAHGGGLGGVRPCSTPAWLVVGDPGGLDPGVRVREAGAADQCVTGQGLGGISGPRAFGRRSGHAGRGIGLPREPFLRKGFFVSMIEPGCAMRYGQWRWA